MFNIGNNSPEKLMKFITAQEQALGNAMGGEIEFKKEFEPINEKIQEDVGFKPETSIEVGLLWFANWYADYYKIK
ncbi:hypothetical protein CIT14_18320 [Virgibacillus profundi]|nr:hypothetical protein [Virgibacillus profundi]PXY52219.1 hypothetical protein CIT14_18320 [Virgibacillus profundi]